MDEAEEIFNAVFPSGNKVAIAFCGRSLARCSVVHNALNAVIDRLSKLTVHRSEEVWLCKLIRDYDALLVQ